MSKESNSDLDNLIIFVVLITLSWHAQASDLSITQIGDKGKISLELLNTAKDIEISINQNGIENMLDASFGYGGISSIDQKGIYGIIRLEAQSSNNNRFSLEQTGDHNRFIGNYTGDQNLTNVVQTGSSNNLEIDIGGISNFLSIYQGGSSNNSDVFINGNNSNVDITQFGVNNNIDFSLFNSNINYSIIQYGSDDSITINN